MKKLEFVEYTGRYPTLCYGRLFVRIDGKLVSFGDYCLDEKGETPDKDIPNYPDFWQSSGYLDEDWCAVQGPWEISDWIKEEEFPPEIRNLLPQLIELFNENVPHGCCGGCS